MGVLDSNCEKCIKELISNQNHLQSLKEYNKERSKLYITPKFNGIACPECGEELYDIDNEILTSYPPQMRIQCLKCEFKDTRLC